ncbi:MAG: LytTR family DNA-binding domain-containing protein [Tannerellaceae bacterium]|jgi:DNA-binding LytR/AlgR family response regulator|nr:LytTR family DNA-binding domain-containing protein [Tannerellaceae bacterium]
MELSCVIIDDEPLAVSLLESYVGKTPFLKLKGTYNSAVDALTLLNKQSVDLIYLDIQMPELSGLEFSRIIDSDMRIVFTTAFGQYALDSYKVNALDYLLKPINYPDFLQSANKALQWYELIRRQEEKNQQPVKAEAETIFIKSEYKLIQIELRKILYIEGLKDYIKIYMEGEARPIISLVNMKTMEDMLPSSRFVRVHRSFIVQPEKIKIIDRNRIVFGKEYIPISDSYRQKFNDFLNEHALMPRI